MNVKTRYIILFLAFVVLSLYYPVLFAPTNSVDDRGMIQSIINNDRLDLKQLFFPGTSGFYYRPLTWLTYITDQYLWGLQPSFMHLENILIHSMNTILVFFITGLICKRYRVESKSLQLAAALLFALHPINTEAVNWISGRTDLLAGFFILLALLFLLKALEVNKILFLTLSSIFFLTGCLAKEVAVFFYPAALILIFFYDEVVTINLSEIKKLFYKRAPHVTFFSVMTLIYFLFRHLAFRQSDGGFGHLVNNVPHSEAGTLGVVLNILRPSFKTFGFYCKKLFIPWPLNFTIVNVSDNYVILGILFFFCCCYLAYKRTLISALFITSVFLTAPAVLVAVTKLAWTPLAERYLYVANTTFSIGIVYAGYVASRKSHSAKYIPYVTVIALVVCAYTTVNRNIIWQDNLTLYADTVEQSSGYPPAKNEFAKALIEHGKVEEGVAMLSSNNVDSTVRYREFAELQKANVLFYHGDNEGARKLLQENLHKSSAAYAEIVVRLIAVDKARLNVLTNNNEKKKVRYEMIDLYKKLYEVDPNPFYYYKIGQMYLFMSQKKEAQRYFAKAYERAPDDSYYKLPAKKLSEELAE